MKLTKAQEDYRKMVEDLNDPVWWRWRRREIARRAAIRWFNHKRAMRYGRAALKDAGHG